MLAESGDEEESDQIVNQVLDEIGIEVSGKVNVLIVFFINETNFDCVLIVYQMRDAPSASLGKIGESSRNLSEQDIEQQLAKLRAP